MPLSKLDATDWFEAEIKPHEGALRGYLHHHVPERVDVDDVVQEAYRRLLEMKKEQPIQSPRGLLFSIARNITRDLFRKKHVSKTISLGEIEVLDVFNSAENASEEDCARNDEAEILQAAIEALPKKCRTIFLLRNYENLSYKEIALKLNLSIKTVEGQLAIGIKKCRKHFEAHGLIDSRKRGK